jgi:hypothetical protein
MTGQRYLKNVGSVVVLALFLTLLVWSPVNAQKKKKSSKSRRQQILFFDVRLELTYDDNIINYSDADLDLYGDNARPDKFAIDSKDDWIITSRLESRLKGRFISGRTAWFDLNFNNYFYIRNEIRRYQKYGLCGRHYFMRGGYIEVEYSYIPDYYYRNQFFEGSYIQANFSKHFLKAEVGLNLLPSLKSDVSYRFQSKSFNEEVRERDLTVNGVRLDAIWNASKKFKFWAYYGFERASARGADDPEPDVKDVSYDAWDITLGSRHYSPLFPKLKPQLVLSLQYRKIKFQTSKYSDIYRFGRRDGNYELRIGTAWQLPYMIGLDIDYKLQAKRTDLYDPSAENLLEYDSNSISFELRRRF